MSLLLIGCLVLVPVFAIVLLKAQGAIVFLSLCLGSVLASYVATDMTDVLTSMRSGQSPLAVSQMVRIILLIAPFVLAMLFTSRTVRGGKHLLNLVTALTSGILFALLIVPLLSSDLQRSIMDQTVWHQISSLQTLVIIVGATLSMIFLLMSRPHHQNSKKHRK